MANFTKIHGIKFLELVLVIVLFVLMTTNRTDETFLHYGTYGGYLIILVGVVGGALMGTPVNRRVDLYFSLIGAILFLVIAITMLTQSSHDMVRPILALITGILFVIDGFFTFRGEA